MIQERDILNRLQKLRTRFYMHLRDPSETEQRKKQETRGDDSSFDLNKSFNVSAFYAIFCGEGLSVSDTLKILVSTTHIMFTQMTICCAASTSK